MDLSNSKLRCWRRKRHARMGWGGEEEGSGAVAFIGRGRENAVRIAESVSEYVHPPQFSFQTFLKTEDSVHGEAYDFRIQRMALLVIAACRPSRFSETDIA
jgi:hypothetical protein